MQDAYSIPSHLSMVADRVRMQAYRQALRTAVKPGCAVADIGTGTGIFAILACRFGARRVYAIEPDAAIEVARRIASENGVADRIEFIRELSTGVALPEPVDVVVSDVRGVLPWFAHALGTVIDARERLLAEGGRLIPARDHVWGALAEARKPHGYDSAALGELGLGVDISAATPFAANSWRRAELDPEQLVSEPQRWATLDYDTVTSTRAEGRLSWTVERESVANGLCVWFDTELIEGVGFSNAPGEPKIIYGQAFFPLETAVGLAPGDHVAVDIEGRLVGDEYVWRWKTLVTTGDGRDVTKYAFEQSSVRSAPVSLSQLRRREAGHLATPSEDGEVDLFVLSAMDGATPIGDIARRLASKFPERFPDADDAFQRVARLSERYSR